MVLVGSLPPSETRLIAYNAWLQIPGIDWKYDVAKKSHNKTSECTKIVFALGDVIMEAMTRRGWEVKDVANRAEVAEQTVRNYLNSTESSPWPISEPTLAKVCRVLRIEVDQAFGVQESPTTPHDANAAAADLRFRFVADSKTVRRIDGVWQARSIDVEVPGVLTYTSPSPWDATITIEQFGNRFEATGIDKDDDAVLATGSLLEAGNWVRFDYWIDNDLLREYGTAMVEFLGCGKQMKGLFIGRDHGHSSNGMVVAELTLTKDEQATHEWLARKSAEPKKPK